MATRKNKRYSEGGDVLGRLMGNTDEVESVRTPRSNMDDSIGPRGTAYMDEPPMQSIKNSELAGQIIKNMGGSKSNGPNDGIPLGQAPTGTSEEGLPTTGTVMRGVPATGVSDAKTALQGMAALRGRNDNQEGMVKALRGAMSSSPYGGKDMGNRMGGMAKGGSVSSASRRGDGIAIKGKTKGRFV